MSAASLANAPSTWAAARSPRWSKLPRSVLPSSATTRRPGAAGASSSCWAWRRKAASSSAGSSACRRARSVSTAGARRERAPKGTFSRPRCTPTKRRMGRGGGGAGPPRRGAAEAGAEGHVQPLAMHADEQADAAVGGGAGQHRQDAEQQQVGEAVALPLAAAARVGDPVQGGEQAGERHHGSFRGEASTLN